MPEKLVLAVRLLSSHHRQLTTDYLELLRIFEYQRIKNFRFE